MAVDWVAVGALIGIGVGVVTLVGVGVAFVQLRRQVRSNEEESRRHRRLVSLTAMIPYTEKYERIMGELPPNRRAEGFWDMPASLATDDKTFATFLKYCNLCSEEFYLKQDILDTELWRVWEGELRTTFTSPFGRPAWARCKGGRHFVSHGDFERQVETWLAEALPTPRKAPMDGTILVAP